MAHGELAWLFLEPGRGLDHGPRILLSCFKARISAGRSSGDGGPVGFMVHTECDYMRPIAYPDVYLSGMSVSKIGNSSVTYKV